MTAAHATSHPQTTLRWRAAAAVGVAVLAVHAGLLGLWPGAPGPGWRAEPSRPLQVRQIRQVGETPRTATAAPSQAARPTAAPSKSAASPPPPVAAAPTATAAATPTPIASASASASAGLGASDATRRADESPPLMAPPGGNEPPVYATRVPAPFTLTFDTRRGLAGGQATLRWQTGPAGYTLALQAQAFGQRLPGSSSLGGFDAAGLAPERHVESRRGRELRAANFQRQAGGNGRITFSGPPVEYALVAGAQDRLSWIVQLAAVLAANPALTLPGAQVSMFVAGARGDGEVWVFAVSGSEAVDLPGGERVEALKLQREPRRPYDTGVQVWVDPARHHLPVRLHLAVRASGEGLEFLLRSSSAP